MKTSLTFALVTLVVLMAGDRVAHAASQDVLTVAIFDFESKDEPVRDLGPKVAALVNANLSANPHIITVERTELEKVLGEHEFGLSGTVSPATAAKIGSLTGAKVLVTGRVFKVDKDTVVVAKIIGTETSRVFGEIVQSASKPITELSADLGAKIAKTVSTQGDALVAKVKSREDRVAAIKKALKGEKLPVVSVKIAERHFNGPTIDPAAETELGKFLLECGFKLADDTSDLKPDVEISGEALSQFGLRRGNLISSKGRVEIKVRDRVTGNILLVDRQTSVAVDITEQTAAKTALQNAASELAERLVLRIVK